MEAQAMNWSSTELAFEPLKPPEVGAGAPSPKLANPPPETDDTDMQSPPTALSLLSQGLGHRRKLRNISKNKVEEADPGAPGAGHGKKLPLR
jgi:hypothetical protein